MTMFSRLIFLVFSILTLVFFSGCSSELSRDKAKRQIIKALNLPKDELKALILKNLAGKTHYYKYADGRKKYSTNEEYKQSELFSSLERQGMITLEKTEDNWLNKNDPYGRYTIHAQNFYWVARLTEKATQYVVNNKIKVSQIVFGEVTGITHLPQFNAVQVDYTEKRTNITPFGQAFGIIEETFEKKVVFRKYDDGWRL